MKPILLSVAGNFENQDRGLVIHDGPRTILCVADGAGGRSGGLEAAVMANEFARQNYAAANTAQSCADLLQRMDVAVARDSIAGETTCGFAVVTAREIFGASVGDSGIWLIPEQGTHLDLTHAQPRRPFIGGGSAAPVAFQHPVGSGWLLLATDGLLKYTSAERIVETCRQDLPEVAAKNLIELVRYQSGALPDDITVILTKL